MENLNLLYKRIHKHRVTIVITAILLLAAFLRLYRVGDYMTFLGDEGRDLLEVKKILSGNLVFLGPRSSAADFYYGPIYFYFITPFLWLFRYDPVGPAVFIGLLGIVTVYLVYYTGKKFFDEKTGVIAAALYTVSPLVIAYSRSSWNPNPLPFVSLLLLYCLYLAVKNNSWKLFLLTGFLMGIAIQLQYLAIFLGIILGLYILVGFLLEKKTRRLAILVRSYASVFGGFIIGWSPFLVFEIRHGFPNLRTILYFMIAGNSEKVYVTNGGFFPNIRLVFFKLFGRLVTRFPPPEQVNINEDPILRIWQIVTIILGIVSVIFLLRLKNKRVQLLLSLWFFVGIFLFGYYRKEIYDYFLGFMFPLPFLLVAYVIATVYDSKLLKYGGKILACSLFLLLFIFNLYANPFRYPPNRQKDQVKKIADFVLSKANEKPYNFALLTDGNSDHGYRYFFEMSNRPPVEIKNQILDPERKTVTDQLLVVCEKPEPFCQPLGDGSWEIAGFGRAEIEGSWQVSVVKVYKLGHWDGDDL